MSSPRRADLGGGIARSAAFRLTLRFAGAFVLCLLLADLVLGFSGALGRAPAGRWPRSRTPSARCRPRFADGRTRAPWPRRSRAVDSDEEDGVARSVFQDPAGDLRAGSLVLAGPSPGLERLRPAGADPDEGFWLRSRRLPDGSWLNVAASTESYHDIAEMMLAGAIWTVATRCRWR